MIGFPIGGAFEYDMFDKVGHSVLMLQLVARSGIQQESAIGHIIVCRHVNQTDSIFEGMNKILHSSLLIGMQRYKKGNRPLVFSR